jgi:hypothetical protein
MLCLGTLRDTAARKGFIINTDLAVLVQSGPFKGCLALDLLNPFVVDALARSPTMPYDRLFDQLLQHLDYWHKQQQDPSEQLDAKDVKALEASIKVDMSAYHVAFSGRSAIASLPEGWISSYGGPAIAPPSTRRTFMLDCSLSSPWNYGPRLKIVLPFFFCEWAAQHFAQEREDILREVHLRREVAAAKVAQQVPADDKQAAFDAAQLWLLEFADLYFLYCCGRWPAVSGQTRGAKPGRTAFPVALALDELYSEQKADNPLYILQRDLWDKAWAATDGAKALTFKKPAMLNSGLQPPLYEYAKVLLRVARSRPWQHTSASQMLARALCSPDSPEYQAQSVAFAEFIRDVLVARLKCGVSVVMHSLVGAEDKFQNKNMLWVFPWA